MSFAVTVVVDLDDGPIAPDRLAALRRDHADVTGFLALSSGPARAGVHTHAEAASAPVLERSQYVWFLTPGAEPDPDALSLLIEALNTAETLGAVGPVVTTAGPTAPLLVSAGVTTTPDGLRVNPVTPGETDAGQYDRRQDVLAVDVPGMLVPAALVRAIGVPSPALDPAYRGIEYCRRIRAAGYRIELAPGAVVAVPEAGPYRSSARPLPSPRALREEHRYRLALTPRSRTTWTMVRLGAAALLAALGCLLANDPRRAAWNLRALLALPADARATARVRRTRSGRDPASVLFASRHALEIARRELRDDGEPAAENERDAGPLDTAGEVARYSTIEVAGRRSLLLHPLTAVLVATGIASGLMLHSLAGPGALTGGALPRLDVPAGAVLDRILTPVDRQGLGSALPADPLLTVLLIAALPFLGDLDLLVRVLWFAALPGAALIMYLCAARLAPPAGIRGLLALVWACSPALLLALLEGRLGTVVAWLLAPVACWALERAVRLRRATAAAGAGLALAVVLAGAPFLVLPVTAALLVLLVVLRRPGLVWTLLPTLGLFAPWLVSAVRHLDVFLTNPGAPFDFATPASYELGLGYAARPGSALLDQWLPDGATPWILLALMLPLLLAGALALTRVKNSLGLLLASTVLYCAGLAGGIVQSALEAGLTADRLIASYPGDSLLLMGLGAVGLIACALWPADFDRASRLRSVSLRILVPGAALLVLGVFTAQSLLGGLALTRTPDSPLPAFATERATGPLGQRTLVLDTRDGQLYGELAGPGTGTVLTTATLHQAQRIGGGPFDRRPEPLDAADTALATAIGGLTAGDGSDVRPALQELAVGFVVVRDTAEDSLSRDVSVSTGLTRLGDSAQGRLWQVETDGAPISAVSLVHPDGIVEPVEVHDGAFTIPAGEDGRTLVVSERAGLTSVRLGGAPLPAAEAGWRTAHAVPVAGGSGTLEDRRAGHTVLAVTGLVVLGLAVITALPFGRSDAPLRTGGSRAVPVRRTAPPRRAEA